MKLYLICGKAESGKNLFGDFLKGEYEKRGKKVCLLRITAPLYEYARFYFGWDGNDETKPRELLQRLGIEVIKNELGMRFFLVDRLNEDIKILDKFFDVGIITDGRLIEEFDELRRTHEDIKLIHIIRNDHVNGLTESEKNHITELDLDRNYQYDYEIDNNSMDDIKLFAEKIVMKEEGYCEF